MLVLSRKCGEKLIIGGGITVTVVRVEGEQVKIGINAPPDVNVRRAELPDESVKDKPAGTAKCRCGREYDRADGQVVTYRPDEVPMCLTCFADYQDSLLRGG